jgi:hypothetical protein
MNACPVRTLVGCSPRIPPISRSAGAAAAARAGRDVSKGDHVHQPTNVQSAQLVDTLHDVTRNVWAGTMVNNLPNAFCPQRTTQSTSNTKTCRSKTPRQRLWMVCSRPLCSVEGGSRVETSHGFVSKRMETCRQKGTLRVLGPLNLVGVPRQGGKGKTRVRRRTQKVSQSTHFDRRGHLQDSRFSSHKTWSKDCKGAKVPRGSQETLDSLYALFEGYS